MLHSQVIDFFWLNRELNLILDTHDHEIEELLHACIIKLHYRAVGKFLEDLFCSVHRVDRLRPEKFLDEAISQETLDDVLEHFRGAFLCHILRSESLV